MSKNWAGGSTRAWRRVRLQVLARDGWVCKLGLDVCTTRATCVHHVLGRGVSGDDPKHLVASCAPCNGKLGDPTSSDPPPSPVTQW